MAASLGAAEGEASLAAAVAAECLGATAVAASLGAAAVAASLGTGAASLGAAAAAAAVPACWPRGLGMGMGRHRVLPKLPARWLDIRVKGPDDEPELDRRDLPPPSPLPPGHNTWPWMMALLSELCSLRFPLSQVRAGQPPQLLLLLTTSCSCCGEPAGPPPSSCCCDLAARFAALLPATAKSAAACLACTGSSSPSQPRRLRPTLRCRHAAAACFC